jgi:hypothetical protein
MAQGNGGSMLKRLIETKILGEFYKIDLSNFERAMADDAVAYKYIPAISKSVIYSVLLMPALLLLDTSIVVSVLIPTTMVAGTAWFSVSLASMKKKFENFGMELTTHLFVAFTLSLTMLFLSTLTALTSDIWSRYIPAVANDPTVKLIAALLAVCVVGKLLLSIFAGSLKYDINDAMLTGQNEAAERFFKQSLSLLFTTSQQLRQGMKLQVANYSLGLAFYEVFNNIKEIKSSGLKDIESLLDSANSLIEKPSMKQHEADKIVLDLIRSFVESCDKREEVNKHRSYQAIQSELKCLANNLGKKEGDEGWEEQKMVDTRMAIVFSEMSNLIEEFGPSLFEGES